MILLGVPYTGGSLVCHRLGASSSLTLGRTLGAAADPQQQPALRLHLAAAALKQRCRRPFSCGATRWRGAQARLLLQHCQWVVLRVRSEAAEVAPTAQPRPPAHQADKSVIAPLGGRVRERPAQAVRPEGLLLVPGQVKVFCRLGWRACASWCHR